MVQQRRLKIAVLIVLLWVLPGCATSARYPFREVQAAPKARQARPAAEKDQLDVAQEVSLYSD